VTRLRLDNGGIKSRKTIEGTELFINFGHFQARILLLTLILNQLNQVMKYFLNTKYKTLYKGKTGHIEGVVK
jgi:hypothetical protein